MSKSIRLTTAVILLTCITILLGFATKEEKKKQPPEKFYIISVTLPQAQLLLNAINTPKGVTDYQREALTEIIATQVNKQISDTATKKK